MAGDGSKGVDGRTAGGGRNGGGSWGGSWTAGDGWKGADGVWAPAYVSVRPQASSSASLPIWPTALARLVASAWRCAASSSAVGGFLHGSLRACQKWAELPVSVVGSGSSQGSS